MPHPRTHLVFILLSVADLGLTYWLLTRPSGSVYEANPFARWCLSHLGWAGMACYKAAAVALVVGLTLWIGRSCRASAGRVLGVGSVVTAAVVVYSAILVGAEASSEVAAGKGQAELEDYNHRVGSVAIRNAAFFEGIASDMIAERCSLAEAADRVARFDRKKESTWKSTAIWMDGGRPWEECAALIAMRHALIVQDHRGGDTSTLSRRLRQQFRQRFGKESPLGHAAYEAAARSDRGGR